MNTRTYIVEAKIELEVEAYNPSDLRAALSDLFDGELGPDVTVADFTIGNIQEL